jgi:hypothetical protein
MSSMLVRTQYHDEDLSLAQVVALFSQDDDARLAYQQAVAGCTHQAGHVLGPEPRSQSIQPHESLCLRVS